MAVAYRKDRLNLIAMETFWLSRWSAGTPAGRPGPGRGPPSPSGGRCSAGDSGTRGPRASPTARRFPWFPEARERALAQLLARAEDRRLFPRAPEVIAGDMNAEPLLPSSPQSQRILNVTSFTPMGPPSVECSNRRHLQKSKNGAY